MIKTKYKYYLIKFNHEKEEKGISSRKINASLLWRYDINKKTYNVKRRGEYVREKHY